jgi:hypothetical protein
MIIIYFIIFIILFYEIYKYISQNINYSQFEHFYNKPDIIYKTITTGLNLSNNIENFNLFDTSYNLVNNNVINPYLYNPINYWYSPLDYWLNPYVYYNWYGGKSSGSSSYSTSYNSPVINTHRRHIRHSRSRSSSSSSSHSRPRRHK